MDDGRCWLEPTEMAAVRHAAGGRCKDERHDQVEHKLLKSPWMMEDKYTICAPYLLTIASWIEGDGMGTTKLSRFMEHRAHRSARRAVRQAVAADGTHIP